MILWKRINPFGCILINVKTHRTFKLRTNFFFWDWEFIFNYCAIEMKINKRGRSQTTLTRFGSFWPSTPFRLHFLWYKSLQKINFFDHLPPSSCKRSLWTPPCPRHTGSYSLIIYHFVRQRESKTNVKINCRNRPTFYLIFEFKFL